LRTQMRHVHARSKAVENSEHHADDEVHHEQPATGTVSQQPLSFIDKAKLMGANAVCGAAVFEPGQIIHVLSGWHLSPLNQNMHYTAARPLHIGGQF
jgi:hypothetical protein